MLFKNYKLAYLIYNFFNKKQLKHNLPLYKKYGLKKKYYSSISSEDFKHIESPLNMFDEKDSRIELPKNKIFLGLPKDIQDSLLSWSRDGYVILEEFFSEEEVDVCNQEIESLVWSKKVEFRYGNKLMDCIDKSQILEEAGNNPKLLKILGLLLGKEIELFQSINFLTGSQQRTHSDSIHMTTFPRGNLIAAWVALEDISVNSGPLHYYPGSHKLPYIMNSDYGNLGTKYKLGSKPSSSYEDYVQSLVESNALKKKVFTAKKGDVLIWHANLLHGGEKSIEKNGSRKSMVFHYYTNDAICYHEITQRPTLKRVKI